MKYLRLFSGHADYESERSGILLPNVSRCSNEMHIHYNPRESIVRGVIRTSDYSKITGGNGINAVYEPTRGATRGGSSSNNNGNSCQFSNASNYYRKTYSLVQRENGVDISGILGDSHQGVIVTRSSEEYEKMKEYDQVSVLLSQDGTLQSYCFKNNWGELIEMNQITYYSNPIGDCVEDASGNCVAYTGKYDSDASYGVNLVSPILLNSGDILLPGNYLYRLFQKDGVEVTEAILDMYKIVFSEEYFINNIFIHNMLWIDFNGVVRAIKVDGEIMYDGEGNYSTTDILPKFDSNGEMISGEYYNDDYIVKTKADDLPYSAIRINGEEIDLNELVLNNGIFYCSDGEYEVEYVLKNRKEIPSYAFMNCVGLEDVEISKKVSKIDDLAFAGCPLLGTDEDTIIRICSYSAEPIVIEAEFDFEEGEEKVLQSNNYGIFYYPSDDGGSVEPIK